MNLWEHAWNIRRTKFSFSIACDKATQEILMNVTRRRSTAMAKFLSSLFFYLYERFHPWSVSQHWLDLSLCGIEQFSLHIVAVLTHHLYKNWITLEIWLTAIHTFILRIMRNDRWLFSKRTRCDNRWRRHLERIISYALQLNILAMLDESLSIKKPMIWMKSSAYIPFTQNYHHVCNRIIWFSLTGNQTVDVWKEGEREKERKGKQNEMNSWTLK